MTEPDPRTEYRVVERSDPALPPFAIYLVTTNESGQVEGAYFPPAPEGGTLLELQANLRQMCQALDKPVLKLEEIALQAKRVTIADLGYADSPSVREVRDLRERIEAAKATGGWVTLGEGVLLDCSPVTAEEEAWARQVLAEKAG